MTDAQKIWPEKKSWGSVFGDEEMDDFFEESEEEAREMYIPGKRPNYVSPQEWEKLCKENPLFNNDDLPVGISKQGEIICLPRIKTAIKIALVGITQYGKSTTMWSVADQLYWQWNYKLLFANEGLSICYDHVYRNDVPVFKKKMATLGMRPHGLPLAFCYPSSQEVNMPGIKPEFLVSIPFEEFLREPSNFVDMGKSSKHLSRVKDSLQHCQSFEDIVKVFEESDMPEQSKQSLLSSVNELVNHKLFDLNNNGHSKLWCTVTKDKFGKGLPPSSYVTYELPSVIALMKAGICPCLITAKLAGSKYEEQVFNYYLRKIWESKDTGGVFRDEPIALMIDELNQVQGNNKEILIKMVREGANMGNGGIGFFWCAQNYTDINKIIRTNTIIGFIFRQADEESRAIAKEFSLSEYWRKKIKSLDKFECVFCTKDKFILYNPETGERNETQDPVLGEVMPPMSLHRGELSLDEYKTQTRCKNKNIERVKRVLGRTLHDKDGNELLPHKKILKQVKGTRRLVDEKISETKEKINVQPLTIVEGENIKYEYFKGKITKIEDITYSELLRRGVRIISAPASMKVEGSTQIRVMYFFWPINKAVPGEARLLQSAPEDVNIVYDNEKNAVRMYSPHCGSKGKLNGVSEWYYF